MAPIGLSRSVGRVRVVVYERRAVAELLAGGGLEVAAGELVDEELRAVAWAVLALRAWRQAPDERVIGVVIAMGGAVISGEDLEQLRREGALAGAS